MPRQPSKPADRVHHRPAALPGHDLVDEGAYRGLAYVDLDLGGRTAEAVEVERCRFAGADLSGVTLDRATFVDCAFARGSLANLHARRSALLRGQVSGVRMTGFTWVDGVVRDTAFEECRLDLSVWRFSRLTGASFTRCNLTRADFGGADLSGSVFTDCDLTRAQFCGATMKGSRFAGCTLVDVGGATSWTGAVVAARDLPALSYSLAAAIGITVSDD